MNKLKEKHVLIPLITAALSLMTFMLVFFFYNPRTVRPYGQFINDLKSGQITKVNYTSTPYIKVTLRDGTSYKTDNPRKSTFKEELLTSGVNVVEQGYTDLYTAIPAALFMLSISYLTVVLLRKSSLGTKAMSSVESLELAAVEDCGFNFDIVAGNEEAKESVMDVVDFLKNPEKYNKYGAKMPRGIMLYGEPGTGKTLLAKAVAGEASVPFYALSGSDFVQVYVGVGASRIRQLFKKARSHKKAVIFIDEIDAIGKKRDGGRAGGSEEKDQTLNALLTEMSGFNDGEGIVVMAATNRLDVLDEALLRPGRFDRHVEVTLPDVSAREKILRLYLKNKPVMDLDVVDWARKTSYFSGAKLENLVNEAAILACKDNSSYITNLHMDKAFSIVLAGYEKQNREHISSLDRRITAYHEIGHALASLLLIKSDKVSKVTIIPSTKGAGGYTLSIPEDRMYQNKDYLKKRIMVMLAGRAAEELIFGSKYITTGAHNDLENSTKLSFDMITNYGMGQSLGLLNLNVLSSHNLPSGDAALKECKELLDELYRAVYNLLSDNKLLLDKLSKYLIEKETLYTEDIEHIMKNYAANLTA